MDLLRIYRLGERSPLKFKLPDAEKKLKFVEFPYSSSAVVGVSLGFLVIFTFLSLISISLNLSVFFTYFFIFTGIILTIASYVYPVNIFYTQRMINYNEEMLKAVMRISTFVSMNTSMEYAIIHTKDHLWGTLRTQFEDIVKKLKLRENNTLGEIFEYYTPIWNSVNPDFVKALRLIETASMSNEDDRMKILEEVQETLIISYHTSGKRFAEELAANAKTLVAVGVLFPIISLMLLPLVSVFMPKFLEAPLIVFTYDVLFPAMLLLMALNFSAKRIQVDTIRLSESPLYTKPPVWTLALGALIIVCCAIPTVVHLMFISMDTPESVKIEYQFSSILICWLLGAGISVAISILSWLYVRKYERLWKEVDETERDMPHLLQTFATYLTLNKSVESIIPEVVDDYKTHGFSKHPVVKFFSTLMHELKVSKRSIAHLTEKVLPKICPSKKVSGMLAQIISFTEVSTESAAKAAKMVRKQTLAIYQLDDYIRTMLSETVSLINITTTLLAPMLCAAAILMSMAIVKSLIFIEEVLVSISLGSIKEGGLGLVKIQDIIPPTQVEVIVSIYLIEMILVLSLFSANIKIGNDNFQLIKTILSNMVGFIIFSIILLGGYFALEKFIFGQFFGGA
ncbi:MAG: hypothetical protein QXK37_06380 [Candidatus Woesearchaeota archaeon]